jgi:aminoglycoside phosphotransferase (APT) family kinase protein
VAVIDFGDATIGHAGFELGPAWWTWLNQDRRYLDAFLDAAEFPGWGSASFPRLALAWSLIRCAWNPKAPPYLDDARDLDELAELAFGAAT